MRIASPAATAVLAAVALAGCGSSSSSSAKTGTKSSAAAAPAPATTTATTPAAAPVKTTVKPSTSRDLTSKPKIPRQTGPAPKTLVVQDIVKGTGPVAQPGQQVTVRYVGVLYSNGKQFDASWDRGQSFPFALGAAQVIPGWDRGVPGMRAGGRRQLTIPADLAYGAQGSPPTIPPNATLIFVVDLLKVGA